MGRGLSAQWPEIPRRQDAENEHLRGQLVPALFWNGDDEDALLEDARALIFGQVAAGSLFADLLRSFGVTPQACMGIPFDSLASNIQEGWVCVAVRAEDNLGNHGVSAPLHMCIDRLPLGTCPAPPGDITDVGTLPFDCVGRYTKFADGTEETNASATCTVPVFPIGEMHGI
jgi:hypothetical protein